jgi:hypothetical protein
VSKLGSVWNREGMARTVRGDQAYPVPCATLYTGLYTVHIFVRQLAAVYAELAAGRPELTLSADEEIDARAEAHIRTWESFDPPFAWMEVGEYQPVASYDGVRVELSPGSCVRTTPSGDRADLLAPLRTECLHVWERETAPTVADLDSLLPLGDADAAIRGGSHELMRRLVSRCGDDVWLISHLGSPYESLSVLGFVGMMEVLHGDPGLADAIIERSLANALQQAKLVAAAGVRGMFIEQCWASSDLISEADYVRFAVPADTRLVAELTGMGFGVLFHMTGGIEGRLRHIRGYGADGVALEDSKKGFVVEMGRARRELGEGTTLWGNLNPVVVRDGPRERIEAELRSLFEQAGPPFVVSCGSPLTLDTPIEHVNMLTRAAAGLAAR